MKIPASAAKQMIPHYESDAPIEDLAVVMKLPDGDFLRDGVPCIPATLKGELVPSPFMAPRLRQLTTMVRDLSSSFVRESPGITTSFMSPTVCVRGSATDLTPQTALFVEALGEHLNLHTIKRRDLQPFSRKLGYDLKTIDRQAIYTGLWGPYLDVMGGRDEKSITREIRAQAIRVARWRLGKDWFSTL